MSEVVRCPKCNSAVSVTAAQSGQRVQCPSCLKQFLAPSSIGVAGTTADDDDWLSLDDSPVETTPRTSASVSKDDSPDSASPQGVSEKRPTESADKRGVESGRSAKASSSIEPEEDPFSFAPETPAAGGSGSKSGFDGGDLFANLPPVDTTPSPSTFPTSRSTG